MKGSRKTSEAVIDQEREVGFKLEGMGMETVDEESPDYMNWKGPRGLTAPLQNPSQHPRSQQHA